MGTSRPATRRQISRRKPNTVLGAGRADEALDTLERMLITAAPESYVRSFIDEEETFSKLLLQALKLNGKCWEAVRPELLRYVSRRHRSTLT